MTKKELLLWLMEARAEIVPGVMVLFNDEYQAGVEAGIKAVEVAAEALKDDSDERMVAV